MLVSLLLPLIVFGFVIEVALIVGKDYILNTRGQAKLEEEIEKTQTDLRESQRRIDDRRATLKTTIEELERQRGQIQAADKLFMESQKVRPVLVHLLGQVNNGLRFRAPVTKDLPAAPGKLQKMIWDCSNFVEVWASDPASAMKLATKQFHGSHGYKVGEFVQVGADPRPVQPAPAPVSGPAADEAAAVVVPEVAA